MVEADVCYSQIIVTLNTLTLTANWLVSEPDPSRGGEERVWAPSYIRVVLTECNYAW